MGRRIRALLASSVLAAGALASALAAGSAGASSAPVTSIDVTFTGHGTGKMTLAANKQAWDKSLNWKLTWDIKSPVDDLQSTHERVWGGFSSYDGDKGYPPKHVVFCKGGVKASGAHAILGSYGFPRAGVHKPANGVKVAGFPTLTQQHATKAWGEVQVPIFGPVAEACFGPSTMAVSGGSYQQEDVGMIYAIFPFNLKHPVSGDYHLHRVWTYNAATQTCDYDWDGTITVVVNRSQHG